MNYNMQFDLQNIIMHKLLLHIDYLLLLAHYIIYLQMSNFQNKYNYIL